MSNNFCFRKHKKIEKSGVFISAFFLTLLLAAPFLLTSCSLTATRPVQLMSDTTAALRAAKEVKADVLVPVIYQEALEAYHSARQNFHLKNYKEANLFLKKAQQLAERAEFIAISKGNIREAAPPDPQADQRFISRDVPDFEPTEDNYEAPDRKGYAEDLIKQQPSRVPNNPK